MRSWGWGACYTMRVGSKLYLAGSPGEIISQSNSWRKGPRCVGQVETQEINGHIGCVYEVLVEDVSRPHDGKHYFAMSGRSCTLLGLSVGNAARATVHPQTGSFEEDDAHGEKPAETHDAPPSPAIT